MPANKLDHARIVFIQKKQGIIDHFDPVPTGIDPDHLAGYHK
jgi:hypothetical protein